MDGLLLAASLREIEAMVLGGVVEQIHMPLPDAILISIYRPDAGRQRLFASCKPAPGRLHLTNLRPENPPEPPAFCMLLRKHLKGKRLKAIEQHGLDRLVTLHFTAGDSQSLIPSLYRENRLVIQLMGSKANIILLNSGQGILGMLYWREDLIDSDAESVDARPIFRSPDPSGKPDPRYADVMELAQQFANCPGDRPAWRAILTAVDGLGPATCRELALRAGIDPEQPWGNTSREDRDAVVREIIHLGQQARAFQFTPSALTTSGAAENPIAVAAISLDRLASTSDYQLLKFPSVQQLCDELLAPAQMASSFKHLQTTLLAEVRRIKERISRKLSAREQDLKRGQSADEYRMRGEILMAYLHQVPRGADHVMLPNFYDPELPLLRIELDPALSPTANAQRYFQIARRLNRTLQMAEQFKQEALAELEYLNAVETAIQMAEDTETLENISAELTGEGYRRRQQVRAKTSSKRPSKRSPHSQPRTGPLRFSAPNGWTYFVGRHNKENDYVTFSVASPDDWWFHVKNEAGAHVIARPPSGTSNALTEEAVHYGAILAAYYSRARHGQNVPVDFTRRRHVKKPRGARPGMVHYTDHRTVYVTPDDKHIKNLFTQVEK